MEQYRHRDVKLLESSVRVLENQDDTVGLLEARVRELESTVSAQRRAISELQQLVESTQAYIRRNIR